ncbi:MAG TPA: flagellar motor switch protein FliG [Gammaproteobacteria bacterium]|nr:flagellar motor switch protein FliG [Gammaproteobacteria bacterium]
MSENISKLPGTERAAVLLLSLGEQYASEILKHMGPKEVQKLGSTMAALNNISKVQVGEVLANFCESVDNETNLGIGSEDYIRNVLVKALGQDKAGGIIDRILMGSNSKGLEALKWMEPRAVAEIIRLEHPQIIAIVLAYLDSDQAAEVIAQFTDRVRLDVLMRIASLDGIQPTALHELNEIMEKQFSGDSTSNVRSATVGGVKSAANILNNMDTSLEAALLEKVKELDADLGQKIQDLMFVFENLLTVDDRGIQALLREVSSENLLLALKGADDAMKDKIFKNMSKRAAEIMRDDLEAKGPVRLSEVEAAQKEILTIARRMADAGDIALGDTGEQFV